MLNLSIERFPKSSNRSLKAWSAADEYILSYLKENNLSEQSTLIYNDTFGYLTCHLSENRPTVIVNQQSQTSAIESNLAYNRLSLSSVNLNSPIDKLSNQSELALVKIPKTIDLFEFYLQHAALHLSGNATVVCAFMTKHFTKGMLEVAERYFNKVEQSRAVKKARLIILSDKKEVSSEMPLVNIEFNGDTYKQYPGVFSAKNIDYATQFLIENIKLPNNTSKILDLACGNGILAKSVKHLNNDLVIHLVDDSFLAIESSKLNLGNDNVVYHHANNLDKINNGQFDYIISNPPFHIEHEIDINLPIELFKQAHRCLTNNGVFQLVANLHLNYKTHLTKIFDEVIIDAQNDKFVVYSCKK